MNEFNILATFITTKTLRDDFINGRLIEEWSSLYPFLFDEKDKEIAMHQRQLGYHYFEWFAAVLLFHTKGFYSLIEAYAYKSHERKSKIIESLVSGDALGLIRSSGISSVTQCPDLFLYKPDRSEWFFCEIKGPQDFLRERQINYFKDLEKISGKKVHIVRFINQEIGK